MFTFSHLMLLLLTHTWTQFTQFAGFKRWDWVTHWLITGSDVHVSPVCASGTHSVSFIYQPLNWFLFTQNVSHRRCKSSCACPVLLTAEWKPEGLQHFPKISEQRSSNSCELEVSGSLRKKMFDIHPPPYWLSSACSEICICDVNAVILTLNIFILIGRYKGQNNGGESRNP